MLAVTQLLARFTIIFESLAQALLIRGLRGKHATVYFTEWGVVP